MRDRYTNVPCVISQLVSGPLVSSRLGDDTRVCAFQDRYLLLIIVSH